MLLKYYHTKAVSWKRCNSFYRIRRSANDPTFCMHCSSNVFAEHVACNFRLRNTSPSVLSDVTKSKKSTKFACFRCAYQTTLITRMVWWASPTVFTRWTVNGYDIRWLDTSERGETYWYSSDLGLYEKLWDRHCNLVNVTVCSLKSHIISLHLTSSYSLLFIPLSPHFLSSPLNFCSFRILKIENSLEYIVNNLEVLDNLSFEEKKFASKLSALNNAHFEGLKFWEDLYRRQRDWVGYRLINC